MLTSPDDDPDEFKFSYENIAPAAITKDETGTLYDFGRETFARVYVGNSDKDALLCYGESETEARDVEDCYLIEEIFAGMGERELPTRAFRYVIRSRPVRSFAMRAPSTNASAAGSAAGRFT